MDLASLTLYINNLYIRYSNGFALENIGIPSLFFFFESVKLSASCSMCQCVYVARSQSQRSKLKLFLLCILLALTLLLPRFALHACARRSVDTGVNVAGEAAVA